MYKISRRAFLKSTAVAGGALAMPTIIRPALAADPKVINYLGPTDFMPKDFRDKFTKQTGIEIRFKEGVTDASQIFNLLAAEGSNRQTDMICIPTQRLFAFTATDMLQPLTDADLPGLKRLNPLYLNWPGSLINGKRYAVPIAAYANMLVYRHGAVSDADAQTWTSLFSDKYAGRVTLREGGALPTAEFALGVADVWWNYKDGDDPAPLEAMLKKTRDYIISRKSVYRKWYGTAAEFQQLFVTDEVDLGAALSQHGMPLVLSDPDTYKRTIPKEGSNGATEDYCILKGAPNMAGCFKLFNAFLSEPNMSAQMSRSSGVMSTFADVTEGLTEQEKVAFSFTPEELARIKWQTVTSAQDPRFPLQDKYTNGLAEA